MLNHEWSLLFFTVLSQFSAGIMIALMGFLFFKNKIKEKRSEVFLRTSLLIAFFAMAVALVLSFFHLNQPLRSVYALSNIKTSWLSREIITASIFLFFTTLATLVFYLRKSPATVKAMCVLSAVAGILFVFSMAKIYMIPTVPPWNTPATVTAFFSTALLLGPLLVLILFSKSIKKSLNEIVTDRYFVLLISLIIIALFEKVISALFVTPVVSIHEAGFQPQQIPMAFLMVRWVLLLVGICLMAISLLRKTYNKSETILWIVFLCFAVSEIIDRVMFYASYYRIGL